MTTIAPTTCAFGTSIQQNFPFGFYASAHLLCTDGKVRKTKRIAACADTYFSVPCSVVVHGKTVAGYMTADEAFNGTEMQKVYLFIAYSYRGNGDLLPGLWPTGSVSDIAYRTMVLGETLELAVGSSLATDRDDLPRFFDWFMGVAPKS